MSHAPCLSPTVGPQHMVRWTSDTEVQRRCLGLLRLTLCAVTTCLGLVACQPRLAPPPQAAARTSHSDIEGATHFAMIGDFGKKGPAAAAVAAQVASWKPEFIVTLGDNNYPSGHMDTFDANVAQYYAPFIKFAADYPGRFAALGSSEQRFFACLGNHDWNSRGVTDHLNALAVPGNGRYYTFSRGPVAFFIVDSDPHEPDGVRADSIQALWLKEALAASSARWKLVVLHHPPFSRGRHGSSLWMQWPFEAWGASAVLSGHDHTFQRLTVGNFPYIVNGLGGAERDHCGSHSRVPHARWSTCYDGSWGALEAWATSEALTLAFITADGSVIDRWTLDEKQPTGAPLDGPRHAEPQRHVSSAPIVSPS